MKERKATEISKALVKKGFKRIKNGKHVHYSLEINGQKTGIRTFMSHGTKPVSLGIQSKMAEQLKINNQQFNDLVECPFSEADYLSELEKQGLP